MSREWKLLKRRPSDLLDNETVTICVCRLPDETHPYVETADFEMATDLFQSLDEKATGHEEIFELAVIGLATCTKAGTWGDYKATRADVDGRGHFIREEGIPFKGWFQSGVDHGLPPGMFDEKLILSLGTLEWRSLGKVRGMLLRGEISREDNREIRKQYRTVLKTRGLSNLVFHHGRFRYNPPRSRGATHMLTEEKHHGLPHLF